MIIRPRRRSSLHAAWAATILLIALHPARGNANLLVNPGNELPLAGGPPGWVLESGQPWGQRSLNPTPFEGNAYFYAGTQGDSEISQTVSAPDAAGDTYEISGRLRSFAGSDDSRLILEFLDASDAVLGGFDSGYLSTSSAWRLVRAFATAPGGTTQLKVRLLARRQAGSNNDGYFDALSLRLVDPSAFGDAVLAFVPGSGEVGEISSVLGIPDGLSKTLGVGGLIEIRFEAGRCLGNDATSAPDLFVYEIGPDVEDTFVAIRPDATTLALLGDGFDTNDDGYLEIGTVSGGTSSIDIDGVFTGFAAGALCFDAVQLQDDPNEGDTGGGSPGADIDAVEALTVLDAPGGAPLPVLGWPAWLILCALLACAGLARTRGREPGSAAG